MARHSFIQMSKLPNVKGRISYITSHAKQENLYATYRTADNTFWNNLARESQQEFLRSGTTGKCIEARELIIALPEIYTTFDPQQVLEEFTNKFRQQYGVECVSALHHNKRKTNYHIHLIFSERKLLPEPDIKIATRSVFYDETGKRVRTKKEITDENGQVRKGCTVIKKGEVYRNRRKQSRRYRKSHFRICDSSLQKQRVSSKARSVRLWKNRYSRPKPNLLKNWIKSPIFLKMTVILMYRHL